MANIWVIGPSQPGKEKTILVRADAITWLSGDTHRVTAARLESGDTITLAEEGTVLGKRTPPLPENFHIALLAKVSQARNDMKVDDEDQFLKADLDDNGEWDWGGPYPATDMAE